MLDHNKRNINRPGTLKLVKNRLITKEKLLHLAQKKSPGAASENLRLVPTQLTSSMKR